METLLCIWLAMGLASTVWWIIDTWGGLWWLEAIATSILAVASGPVGLMMMYIMKDDCDDIY